MTSISLRNRAHRTRALRVEWLFLRTWALALVLLLPLSLLWAHNGLLVAAGVGYLIIYCSLMSIPLAINLLAAFDAVRVIVGRPSTIMVMFLATLVASARVPVEKRPRAHWSVQLFMLGCPLMPLMIEVWRIALQRRPSVVQQIVQDALRVSATMSRQGIQGAPTVVIAETEQWRDELASEGFALCS